MSSRTYCDHNATSPMTKAHWEELQQIMEGQDGNASSIHKEGRFAKKLIEDARNHLASLLGSNDSSSVIFTSCATESNNLVISSKLLEGFQATQAFTPKNVVLSQGEHASVKTPLEHFAKIGLCSLSYVNLLASGQIDEIDLMAKISKDTDLVCLIHVNNETGAISPVEDLASKIKSVSPKAHVHIDGVQSLGKLSLHLAETLIDSMSFSAHKIGGLKGIGAVYLKHPNQCHPIYLGASQEGGLRAGTQFVQGAVSFGLKAKLIKKKPDWLHRAHEEGKALRQALLHDFPKVHLHGQGHLVESTINFHIPGITAQELLLHFDLAGIALSSGSACSSGQPKPSATLLAMGYSPEEAAHSIRVSFGPTTQPGDSTKVLEVIASVLQRQSKKK